MSFLQSFKHPLSVRTFYRTNTPPLPRKRITLHTTRQTPPSFNALPLFELIGKRRWHCRRTCVGFTCCADSPFSKFLCGFSACFPGRVPGGPHFTSGCPTLRRCGAYSQKYPALLDSVTCLVEFHPWRLLCCFFLSPSSCFRFALHLCIAPI
jgi:hypothetical protein